MEQVLFSPSRFACLDAGESIPIRSKQILMLHVLKNENSSYVVFEGKNEP